MYLRPLPIQGCRENIEKCWLLTPRCPYSSKELDEPKEKITNMHTTVKILRTRTI